MHTGHIRNQYVNDEPFSLHEVNVYMNFHHYAMHALLLNVFLLCFYVVYPIISFKKYGAAF